jgi:hypothetical protein
MEVSIDAARDIQIEQCGTAGGPGGPEDAGGQGGCPLERYPPRHPLSGPGSPRGGEKRGLGRA